MKRHSLSIVLVAILSGIAPVASLNCTSPVLDSPTWTLNDWSTDFTTPDGGAVIFRLSNVLTGYGCLCFRRGLFPEGQCIWAEGDVSDDDETQTSFIYDETTGDLEIRQGWSCFADSGRVRVEWSGLAVVKEECELGEVTPVGVICGAQGGSGQIYADKIVSVGGKRIIRHAASGIAKIPPFS